MKVVGIQIWCLMISLLGDFCTAFVLRNEVKLPKRVSLDDVARKNHRNLYYTSAVRQKRDLHMSKYIEKDAEMKDEISKLGVYKKEEDKNVTVSDQLTASEVQLLTKEVEIEEEDEGSEFDQMLSRLNDDPWIEISSGVLVLLSSLLVAIGTLPFLSEEKLLLINGAQDAITVIFSFEFMARWVAYSSMKKKKTLDISYLWQPMSLVDVVSVWVPLLILTSNRTLSALVNLRLLRILKLQRVLEDTTTFNNFIKTLGFDKKFVRPYQLQLSRVLLSIFTLLSISTGFIYSAEHEINPQFPDYFTALYFGLTTLTTGTFFFFNQYFSFKKVKRPFLNRELLLITKNTVQLFWSSPNTAS